MASPVNMDLDWREQRVIKKDGRWTVDGRPTISVEVAWHESPTNITGKAFVGLKVTAPVNSASPPHRHGGAAVSATVIEGRMLNQMVCPDGRTVGPTIYEKGQSWYEPPGCHHVRSENVGDEVAVFIANFVADEKLIKEKGVVPALVQIDAAMEIDAAMGKKELRG